MHPGLSPDRWAGSHHSVQATLYIYLSGALQPSTSVLSVWLKETNDPDDANCGSADAAAGSQELSWYESKWCHQCSAGRSYLEGDGIARPCFDAPFLALLSVVGSFFGLLGTAVYNGYFSQLSYRRIFAYTQARSRSPLHTAGGAVMAVWMMASAAARPLSTLTLTHLNSLTHSTLLSLHRPSLSC